MRKRLLVLVITGLLMLLTVPLLEAGCGCPDEIDDIDVQFSCNNLRVSWSHGTGIASAILVVNYTTLDLITQQVFNAPSGSISINFDPPLAKSTTLAVLIVVLDGGTPYISELGVNCVDEADKYTCVDGRLTYTLCQPLVVYPVRSDDGVGLNVYLVPRDTEGIGQFKLYIPAETLDGLPDQVAANCTIDSSADGQVVAYLLSSGQYQISAGPDEEGKVFDYIFNDLTSSPVTINTYIAGMKPGILPACI